MGLILENCTVEFLYGFLLIFWIAYLYFVVNFGYWEERGVPDIPAVFPFGSTSEIVLGRRFVGTAYDNIYKEFKDERFVGFTDVRRPSLLIRDPDLVKLILQKDFNSFTDHLCIDGNPKDYMLNNLFNLKGQEWKEMRHKLTPAYTAAKMKMMFFLVKKCSDILREVLQKTTDENNAVDVKDIFSRFTVDIIASCAFGIEINSLSNRDAEFYQMGRNALKVDFTRLLKTYIYNAFPIFKTVYCFDFYDTKIKRFITEVVRTNVDLREKLNINRYDFLDLLIKLKQNQSILEDGEKSGDFHETSKHMKKEGLTIEEITSETFVFFTAGFESTASTIQFCLYELACSCLIQEKVYQEVKDVLDRHQGDISYQALQEMTYMDMVINETMRRYPVFPFIERSCTQTYRIPNSTLTIENGLKIIIPAYSFHHDPKYFPDPYTFNPDRFEPKASKERHPFVYLPFGEGPRMCIGFRFGLMKVKAALATVISDYHVNLTPDTEVPLTLKGNSYTTAPSKPLMLLFSKR